MAESRQGNYLYYKVFEEVRRCSQIALPQAITTRNCRIEEGERGAILNSKTRQPFDTNDQCIERGAHVAYNAAATIATRRAVKEFLVTQFRLNP